METPKTIPRLQDRVPQKSSTVEPTQPAPPTPCRKMILMPARSAPGRTIIMDGTTTASPTYRVQTIHRAVMTPEPQTRRVILAPPGTRTVVVRSNIGPHGSNSKVVRVTPGATVRVQRPTILNQSAGTSHSQNAEMRTPQKLLLPVKTLPISPSTVPRTTAGPRIVSGSVYHDVTSPRTNFSSGTRTYTFQPNHGTLGDYSRPRLSYRRVERRSEGGEHAG